MTSSCNKCLISSLFNMLGSISSAWSEGCGGIVARLWTAAIEPDILKCVTSQTFWNDCIVVPRQRETWKRTVPLGRRTRFINIVSDRRGCWRAAKGMKTAECLLNEICSDFPNRCVTFLPIRANSLFKSILFLLFIQFCRSHTTPFEHQKSDFKPDWSISFSAEVERWNNVSWQRENSGQERMKLKDATLLTRTEQKYSAHMASFELIVSRCWHGDWLLLNLLCLKKKEKICFLLVKLIRVPIRSTATIFKLNQDLFNIKHLFLDKKKTQHSTFFLASINIQFIISYLSGTMQEHSELEIQSVIFSGLFQAEPPHLCRVDNFLFYFVKLQPS